MRPHFTKRTLNPPPKSTYDLFNSKGWSRSHVSVNYQLIFVLLKKILNHIILSIRMLQKYNKNNQDHLFTFIRISRKVSWCWHPLRQQNTMYSQNVTVCSLYRPCLHQSHRHIWKLCKWGWGGYLKPFAMQKIKMNKQNKLHVLHLASNNF